MTRTSANSGRWPNVARALELYRLYYLDGQPSPSYLAELHRLIQAFEMKEAVQYYSLVRPLVKVLPAAVRTRPAARSREEVPVVVRHPPYRLVVPAPIPPAADPADRSSAASAVPPRP